MMQGPQSQCSEAMWRDGLGRVMGVYRRKGTHMPVANNTNVGPTPSQYCNHPPIKINKLKKCFSQCQFNHFLKIWQHS